MHGLCADQGVAVIPWSPLARGRLTRDWGTTSSRNDTDKVSAGLYSGDDRPIVEQVARVAGQRGVPRAQVALAWVLGRAVVTAPLIGATKISHIDDAVAALDLRLTDEETAGLQQAYTPRPIAGFQ